MASKNKGVPTFGILSVVFAALGFVVFGVVFESMAIGFGFGSLQKEEQTAPAIIGLVLGFVGFGLLIFQWFVL